MLDLVNHLKLNAHKMTMGGERKSESNLLLTFDKQIFANLVPHFYFLFLFSPCKQSEKVGRKCHQEKFITQYTVIKI